MQLHHLQDTEENKLVYMDVFHQYCEMLESTINQQLTKAMRSFDMDWFLEQLDMREGELDAEVSVGCLSFFPEKGSSAASVKCACDNQIGSMLLSLTQMTRWTPMLPREVYSSNRGLGTHPVHGEDAEGVVVMSAWQKHAPGRSVD